MYMQNIDSTEKNTQYADTTSPVDTIEKSRPEINFWRVSTIVLLFVVLGGILYFYFTVNKNPSFPQQEIISINKQSIPSPKETATMAATSEPIPDTVPVKNALYLASFQGQEVIFLTNDQHNIYYEGGVKKTDPLIGQVQHADGSGSQPISYSTVQNPKKIFTYTNGQLQGVSNFVFDSTKSNVYINFLAILPGESYPNVTNYIYQIDLQSLQQKMVWSHVVGDEKYQEKGATVIEAITNDSYMTLRIQGCYACGGGGSLGTLVLNLQTSSEKYLGSVGNLQFDLEKKTVAFQKETLYKEPCEPGYGCDNGFRDAYKPSGQIYTENLP